MPASPRVIVVGGGIVGLSAAYAIARQGASVTVLERTRPAAEATGRSFAWLNNQAFFRNTDDIEEADARHYFMLHRLALGAWRRTEQTLGDVGIRWKGLLAWCRPGPEQERFEGELARRQHWGGPARRVGASEIEMLVPGCTPGPVGTGYYGPDEASLDPVVAVEVLAGACLKLGVDLRWPCQATRLLLKGNRAVGVETPEGPISGDSIIVAAGTQTPELATQVGVTVPLVESHGAIIHLAPMPMFLDPVLLAPGIHAVQRQDGRLAIAEHFAGSPVVEGVFTDPAELLGAACALLPQLRSAEIERTTVGHRVLPADGLPIIGRGDDYQNVVCVATNAGVSLAALLAELLRAEVIDGAEVDLLAPYRATRFAKAGG